MTETREQRAARERKEQEDQQRRVADAQSSGMGFWGYVLMALVAVAFIGFGIMGSEKGKEWLEGIFGKDFVKTANDWTWGFISNSKPPRTDLDKYLVGTPKELIDVIDGNWKDFVAVLKEAGVEPDLQKLTQNGEAAKLLLGNEKVIKGLLTHDKLAPALIRALAPELGNLDQVLKSFKEDDIFTKGDGFKRLSQALANSGDVKKTLIDTMQQLLPDHRKGQMMVDLAARFGVTDPNAKAIIAANPVVLATLYATLGQADAGKALELFTGAKGGKGLDIGAVAGLMEKHGAAISAAARGIVLPESLADVKYKGGDGKDVTIKGAELRTQIEGLRKFVGNTENVTAITNFVKNSGLTSNQVQKIFGALQAADPKAVIAGDAELKGLVIANVNKIGDFLRTLKIADLDPTTRGRIGALRSKDEETGKYSALELLFGIETASAPTINSTREASADKIRFDPDSPAISLPNAIASMRQAGVGIA